mmetsp:Transcript_16714/g.38273  ORF Transcript_16714/g.38273 Transcript_16714/m.38273 type:complete len:424 (-) Transcript_16714:206-1477(-)
MKLLRRLGATSAVVGGSLFTIYPPHSAAHSKGTESTADSDALAQLQRQADKARRRAQERVRLGSQEMLGMTPKLWLEALDEHHRYGSVLHHYWQRWEASRTRWMFFEWLDTGRGALIDLPIAPRRLLEEAKTLYLTREQLKLCEVRIERCTGRLLWCADGEPVTLPLPLDAHATPRGRAVTSLIEERLKTSRRRETLLRAARNRVEDAMRREIAASPEALDEVTAPLVREGLLRALRDEHFHQRSVVLPKIQDSASYQQMWERFKVRSRWSPTGELVDAKKSGPAYALPSALLPGLRWPDVLAAIEHEEGRGMPSGRMETADERLWPNRPGKGGIFVVDMFGTMHAAQKVSGALHHSSLTGGHCCRFAGSITVEAGRVRKVSPHSGHYVPTQEEYDALIDGWRRDGLDLSAAEVCGLVKERRP